MRHTPSAAWGIALVLLATVCFATLGTSNQFLTTNGVPVVMAVWFRYLFQGLSTTALLLPLRGRAGLRTAHPRFQVLRGLLLATSSVFAFYSLKHMSVAEFTAIVAISPLAVTLLAATLFGEHVSRLRWSLVAGGFAGTLIIIRPGSEDFGWTVLLPVVVVVLNVGFQLLTSRLARTEDAFTMHFYTGWVGTLAMSLALPFFWTALPSWQLWAGVALVGLAGTTGHFLLILAFMRTTASTLTPFFYSQIAFAMLGGWLVFSYVPDGWSLAGMALIAVCGVLSAWLTAHENRRSPPVLPVKVQPVES